MGLPKMIKILARGPSNLRHWMILETSFPSITPKRIFARVSASKESGSLDICSKMKPCKHIRSISIVHSRVDSLVVQALPALRVWMSWRWKSLSRNKHCFKSFISRIWCHRPLVDLDMPPKSHRVSRMLSREKADRVNKGRIWMVSITVTVASETWI